MTSRRRTFQSYDLDESTSLSLFLFIPRVERSRSNEHCGSSPSRRSSSAREYRRSKRESSTKRTNSINHHRQPGQMCRISIEQYSCGHASAPQMKQCSLVAERPSADSCRGTQVTGPVGTRELAVVCRHSLEKKISVHHNEDICPSCNETQEIEFARRARRRSRAFTAFDAMKEWNKGTTRDEDVNPEGAQAVIAGKAERLHTTNERTTCRSGVKTGVEIMPDGTRIWRGYDPNGPHEEDWISWAFAK